MYLANQLDGKIFKDPSLLPSRAAYDQFIQTKVRTLMSHVPTPCKPAYRLWKAFSCFEVSQCEACADHKSAAVHMLILQWAAPQISFNGGENWVELTAPEHPTFPECSTCRPSDTCKLHLHGPSSWHYGAGMSCIRCRHDTSVQLRLLSLKEDVT